MPAALIVGASRGLGLEFVRQYRAEGWKVIGTARNAEGEARIAALGATALRLDADAPDAIDVETSIAGMRRVLAGLKPAQNGSFIGYDGTALPW